MMEPKPEKLKVCCAVCKRVLGVYEGEPFYLWGVTPQVKILCGTCNMLMTFGKPPEED
jgi:hypothetical protein